MLSQLVSLHQAKEKGLLHYFTGEPCGRGHVSSRFTSTRMCKECAKENAKNYRESTSQINEGSVKYVDDIPCVRGHVGEKYSAGKVCVQCCKENSKKYRELNSEQALRRSREFKKRHPDRVNADTAKRRACKILATPKWLDKNLLAEIRQFYRESKSLEKLTGIPHHVDHIVPLNGETVSGLHVPWNLRVIPWDENLRKSNTLLENFI